MTKIPFSSLNYFLLSFILFHFPVKADQLADFERQQVHQQQSEDKHLQQLMQPNANIRFEHALVPKQILPEQEQHCFSINHIELTEWQENGEKISPHKLNNILHNTQKSIGLSLPQCLGIESIKIIIEQLQNQFIHQGYITTRIYLPDQDLSEGILKFTVVAGKIADIHWSDKSSTPRWKEGLLWSALPLKRGDLFNLRALEQGLENFKRVRSADVDIEIVPNEKANAVAGESDLYIRYRQNFPLRLSLGMSNGGNKNTGRLQTNTILSLDNPFSLNDLFYLNFNHSFKQKNDEKNKRYSKNISFGYSIPWRNWEFSTFFSNHHYYQTVFGFYTNYGYWGKSKNAKINAAYLLYRDTNYKAYLDLGLWRRQSQNFIDDTEIHSQKRHLAGWDLGLRQQIFFDNSILNVEFHYKRGTGIWGAETIPTKALSRPKIISANLQYQQNVNVGVINGLISTDWQFQWNKSPLLIQDMMSIGGRYSVRGFSGELTLSGERGWIGRNEIAWKYKPNHQFYSAVDVGRVSGESQKQQKAKVLIGTAIGVRGQFSLLGELNYDLFIGKPLQKPKSFKADKNILGFSFSYQF
ncbi:ShlB/FhaC/HecB family hemolysin secretion/activation protein [Pasteurellaceae bacterium USgator11]|nr:ShlB/FhaC/HecB family hemolysin secretion/activation protein [Pasteurellaceae bacterium USgator11]